MAGGLLFGLLRTKIHYHVIKTVELSVFESSVLVYHNVARYIIGV